jgi:hypothetical protein
MSKSDSFLCAVCKHSVNQLGYSTLILEKSSSFFVFHLLRYTTVPLLGRVSSWKEKGELEGGRGEDRYVFISTLYRIPHTVKEFFAQTAGNQPRLRRSSVPISLELYLSKEKAVGNNFIVYSERNLEPPQPQGRTKVRSHSLRRLTTQRRRVPVTRPPGPDEGMLDPLVMPNDTMVSHVEERLRLKPASVRSWSGPKMELESAHVEIPTSDCLFPRRFARLVFTGKIL